MQKKAPILALDFLDEDLTSLSNALGHEGCQFKLSSQKTLGLASAQGIRPVFQLAILWLDDSLKSPEKTINTVSESFPNSPIFIITDKVAEKSQSLLSNKQIIDIRSFDSPISLARSICREINFQHHRNLFQLAQRQTKKEQKRIVSILEHSGDGLALIYNGKYLSVNPAYKRIFCIPSKEDLIGYPIKEFSMLEESTATTPDKTLNLSIDTLPNNQTISVQIQTRENTSFLTTLHKTEHEVKGKLCTQILVHNPEAWYSLKSDFTDLRSHDVETGLFNKRFIIEYISTRLKNTPTQGSLAIILIDDFRNICEKNSMDYSDNLLHSISQEILSSIDADDVFARFGDHVFSLYSEQYSNADFSLLCEKILSNISSMLFGSNKQFTEFTLSIGIRFIDKNISSARQLIAQADKACDTANLNGGNQIHIFDSISTPLKVLEDEEKNIQLIQAALKHEHLQTLYQPIVDLSSENTENYAVLLRIIDSANKHVSPDHFIHAAEHSGLIVDLDKWVLSNTIQQIRQAERLGIKRRFFITLSRASYQDQDFITSFLANIKFYNIDSSLLVFQINLSESSSHPSHLQRFISKVKDKSFCKLALDQAGLSELNQQTLQDLTIDYIKIDGALTQKIIDNEEALDSLKNIVLIAKDAGVKTIAKSVEDANTMATLWNLGVDGVQGYFLQKPSDSMSFDFDL